MSSNKTLVVFPLKILLEICSGEALWVFSFSPSEGNMEPQEPSKRRAVAAVEGFRTWKRRHLPKNRSSSPPKQFQPIEPLSLVVSKPSTSFISQEEQDSVSESSVSSRESDDEVHLTFFHFSFCSY